MNDDLFPMRGAIGIFDSGVGGLSVYREVRKKLPHQPIIYFGDQIHVPYGPRELDEVYALSKTITEFLISLGAQIIVVACNTASAASLYPLRKDFPHIPFVGMEPAVKPAAEHTQTGKVGVLATPATFQGKLYNSVVERFAKSVTLFQNTCPGLVQEIEKGNFHGQATRKILEEALIPMLENHIDTVVLGCTHYPFVIPLIREIVGKNVTVIDPSPAIANQTFRKFSEHKLYDPDPIQNLSYLMTTGSVNDFSNFIEKIKLENFQIFQAKWSEDLKSLNLVQEKSE